MPGQQRPFRRKDLRHSLQQLLRLCLQKLVLPCWDQVALLIGSISFLPLVRLTM
jgi:hypothetical protein